jgi:hypothetical protein
MTVLREWRWIWTVKAMAFWAMQDSSLIDVVLVSELTVEFGNSCKFENAQALLFLCDFTFQRN